MTAAATAKPSDPPWSETSWIGESIELPFGVESPILALGPQFKNTACLAKGRLAGVSRLHGDLSIPENYRAFAKTINIILEQLRRDSQGERYCEFVVHDLHPTYASTLFARTINADHIAVQHHHAHGVACALDAGVDPPLIAIVCDGTGYGTDGAIWGGEVLLCRADSFDRIAHLDYFGLPGGDAAALAPWRCADAVMYEAFRHDTERQRDIEHAGVSQAERSLLHRQIEAGVNSIPCSSLGRLFDAAAALLGIATVNNHEGEAAMKLQTAAEEWAGQHEVDIEPYPFDINASDHQPARLDWRPLIRTMQKVVDLRETVASSAYRFHATVAAMFSEAAARAAHDHGLSYVALSGGCFLNTLLTRMITDRLEREGLKVLTHRRVSCGDAGLSLGQAAIGAAVAARRTKT